MKCWTPLVRCAGHKLVGLLSLLLGVNVSILTCFLVVGPIMLWVWLVEPCFCWLESAPDWHMIACSTTLPTMYGTSFSLLSSHVMCANILPSRSICCKRAKSNQTAFTELVLRNDMRLAACKHVSWSLGYCGKLRLEPSDRTSSCSLLTRVPCNGECQVPCCRPHFNTSILVYTTWTSLLWTPKLFLRLVAPYPSHLKIVRSPRGQVRCSFSTMLLTNQIHQPPCSRFPSSSFNVSLKILPLLLGLSSVELAQ